MPGLFDQLMQRQMVAPGPQSAVPSSGVAAPEMPGQTPPSPALGMWSKYSPPPAQRPMGWTMGQGPTKPQPNQQTQAIGSGPGSATPPSPAQEMPTPSVVPGAPPMPPNPGKGVPPQAQRFANSQMMQEAYRNG